MIQSLALNHPFVDGNKRTALASTEYFLHLNGIELEATQEQKVGFTLWVENQKPVVEEIAKWIKLHQK